MSCFAVVFGAVCVLSFTDGWRSTLCGFDNRCAGRVPGACSDRWGWREGRKVCADLKCGWVVGVGRSSFGSGCERVPQKTCRGGAAAVVCSGGIPKPDVSILPSAEVTWGNSVNISCAIPDEIHELIQGKFKIFKRTIRQVSEVTQSSFSSVRLRQAAFEDIAEYRCCYKKNNNFEICGKALLNVTIKAPTISVSSSTPQRATNRTQVTRGHSFTIVCSSSTLLPAGRLLLLFSGTNTSISKPAVNHSASFFFPESRFEHEGEYSCVHKVNGSGRTHTSPPSASIMVTVKEPLLPVVLPVAAVGLLLLVSVGGFLCCRRKRRHVTASELTTKTPAPMKANEYKEDDDEEEADYINIPGEADVGDEGQWESADEPCYVNVSPPHGANSLDIYGGDDNIYENDRVFYVDKRVLKSS